MLYRRRIATRILLGECDAALEPAMEEVFNSFSELAATGHSLGPETTMQFGWSPLMLQPEPGHSAHSLRIYEPEFARDPQNAWRPELTTTLSVLRDQVNWLRLLGVEGRDIRFDGPLVATPDALPARRLFALREQPATERDTGWCLAPVPAPGQRIDTRSLLSMRVYELLATRPEVLAVLGLPVGFLVEFDGGQVRQISNGEGRILYQA